MTALRAAVVGAGFMIGRHIRAASHPPHARSQPAVSRRPAALLSQPEQAPDMAGQARSEPAGRVLGPPEGRRLTAASPGHVGPCGMYGGEDEQGARPRPPMVA
jgi:hypothetical protein